MTQPGIEPKCSGPFANTLPTRPIRQDLEVNKLKRDQTQIFFSLMTENSGFIKYS